MCRALPIHAHYINKVCFDMTSLSQRCAPCLNLVLPLEWGAIMRSMKVHRHHPHRTKSDRGFAARSATSSIELHKHAPSSKRTRHTHFAAPDRQGSDSMSWAADRHQAEGQCSAKIDGRQTRPTRLFPSLRIQVSVTTFNGGTYTHSLKII